MSNFNQFHSNEELTSPSSDEKMDTASESFRSQDTPNSVRSSDFEDQLENVEQSVLRLQNPEEIGDVFRVKRSDDVLSSISDVSDEMTSKIGEEEHFLKLQNVNESRAVENLSKSFEDNSKFLRAKRSEEEISNDLISKSSDDDENFLKVDNSNFGNLKTPDVFKNFQKDTKVDVKSSVDTDTDKLKYYQNGAKAIEGRNGEITNTEGFKSNLNTNQDVHNIQNGTKSTEYKNFETTKVDITKSPKRSALNTVKSEELNDSLLNKMSSLRIDSPKDLRPKNLGISPPKFSSTLTLTTNHPLMGLGSPDDFPDLIPKKYKEEDKDLSLSSIEDDRPSEINGLYSPQTNTSKNNLYFTENFVTAESHILSESLELPPDVTRINRRKIVPKFELTPQRNLVSNVEGNKGESGVKLSSHSTPKCSLPVDITTEEFHSGVAEWADSPSQLRAMPNFDLPIEMSSAVGMHNDLDSPDLISSSTPEERSAYEAKLDPYTGSVALRQTAPKEPARNLNQRRKIMLPPEDDRCSLDSLSASDMESEEEPPAPTPAPLPADTHTAEDADMSDDDTRRSKSTNTISYSSEPIPEYSLCEELSNERGWVSVHSHACDVKVIEPYKRVLSHGGYSSTGAALIVFSACHLPDNARHDYTYVMDNLFLYVIWSLERLVTDEYILVYLHGSAARRRLPAFSWLHECYKLIDRRLRKSLKQLYLVHPTFWLKSFVLITKPFVSSKFVKKLCYVKSLDELMEKVPVDPNAIPEIVKQYDANRKR